MRPCSGLLVVAVLSATVVAGCGSDSKKNSDGGNPDSLVFDAALPDASISDDSADVSPGQADAGIPDLVDLDSSLPEDAQGMDGPLRSGVFMTPTSASLLACVACSASTIFHVSYTGDAPTVTITGAHRADFSFTTDCDRPMTGDAVHTCEVIVTYSPKAATLTDSTATLTVTASGIGGSSSAALTGTATSCNPPHITGQSTDLGKVIVGSTGTEFTFTIANNGGEDVAPGIIEISSSPARFVLATDNCSGKSLPSGNKCTFTVQFKPVAGDAGVVQGQLKAILGTGACLTSYLQVSGTAVPPAKLALEPKVLEFGSVPILQESQPLTLTVSNIGGAPTGALKVDKTGAQFKIKSDTCTDAKLSAAGILKTCTIIVTYTPAAVPSEATGSITVSDTSGAAAAPATASLHGSGTPYPTLVLSPASVCPQSASDDPLCIPSASTNRFDNVPVGQATPEMPFVFSHLTSPADAPDTGDMRFDLGGECAADFAIVKNDCAAAPLVSTTGTPNTCTVTVTFKPSAAGLRKAILKVTTTRGGSAQATLEGKGLI